MIENLTLLSKLAELAEPLSKAAKKLKLHRIMALPAWWSSGTPTQRLSRHRWALAGTSFALFSAMAGTGPSLYILNSNYQQLIKRVDQQADLQTQLMGENFTLNASFQFNASEYERILVHEPQAREHVKAALDFAAKAIATLPGPTRDINRDDWQRLQRINYLALAHSIHGMTLAEMPGAPNRRDSEKSLRTATKLYAELFEKVEAVDEKSRQQIAEDIPALLADAKWYKALCTTVLAQITKDRAILGDAIEQIDSLRYQNGNICPVELNRRFSWALEQAKSPITSSEYLGEESATSFSSYLLAESPGSGGGGKGGGGGSGGGGSGGGGSGGGGSGGGGSGGGGSGGGGSGGGGSGGGGSGGGGSGGGGGKGGKRAEVRDKAESKAAFAGLLVESPGSGGGGKGGSSGGKGKGG